MAANLTTSEYIATKPGIGDSGSSDGGVFLVCPFGPWGQPMLPDGHCLPVFPEWPI